MGKRSADCCGKRWATRIDSEVKAVNQHQGRRVGRVSALRFSGRRCNRMKSKPRGLAYRYREPAMHQYIPQGHDVIWNVVSWCAEARLLVMESGIHGCGIRNPQTWNPESKTLSDYLTWGERMAISSCFFRIITSNNILKLSLDLNIDLPIVASPLIFGSLGKHN